MRPSVEAARNLQGCAGEGMWKDAELHPDGAGAVWWAPGAAVASPGRESCAGDEYPLGGDMAGCRVR